MMWMSRTPSRGNHVDMSWLPRLLSEDGQTTNHCGTFLHVLDLPVYAVAIWY